jgi:hypothetical protein
MTQGLEPPRSKKSQPLVWFAIGCGVLVAGVIVFIGVIFVTLIGATRSSTPYQDGLARASTDARVIALLGEPVKARWWFTGSIKVSGNDGNADLHIPLAGSTAKGDLYVKGTKTDGRWEYETMTVTRDGAAAVDLLRR